MYALIFYELTLGIHGRGPKQAIVSLGSTARLVDTVKRTRLQLHNWMAQGTFSSFSFNHFWKHIKENKAGEEESLTNHKDIGVLVGMYTSTHINLLYQLSDAKSQWELGWLHEKGRAEMPKMFSYRFLMFPVISTHHSLLLVTPIS